jgi:GNAT superfamily N-acetyltransferase
MTASDGATVRPAVPEDLPAVMGFIRNLAAYEHLTHESVATPSQIGAALFGSPPRLYALVAEVEAQAAGVALWFYTFSTFTGRPSMYLEDLFVSPAFRGRGVARCLFRALARRAVAEECARVEWAVLDWNELALRFYRSLGAKPREGWTVQRLSGPELVALAA